jgi:hypothetical protein
MIKSRDVIGVCSTHLKGKTVLVWKPERMKPLGRYRCRWDITMSLKDIILEFGLDYPGS